jgi:hypothetical protein
MSPGPGSYNLKPENLSGYIHAPRAFIAGKNSVESRDHNPSPLDYSPSVESVLKSSPKAKIGTQR